MKDDFSPRSGTADTYLHAAIGRQMQEVVVGYAAQTMLASFAFKGTKETLAELRQEFAGAYGLAVRLITAFTRKKVRIEDLSQIGFAFVPTEGSVVMCVRHEWQGKEKRYRVIFHNEEGDSLPQSLEKKEYVIAADGQTITLLQRLLQEL